MGIQLTTTAKAKIKKLKFSKSKMADRHQEIDYDVKVYKSETQFSYRTCFQGHGTHEAIFCILQTFQIFQNQIWLLDPIMETKEI